MRNLAIYFCITTRKIPLMKYAFKYFLTCPHIFYHHRYDQLFQVPSLCLSHSCLRRLGKSHYIYAEFILKTFDRVVALTIKPPIPTPGGKIAVLVEPREHPLLEYTVKQVMSVLGPDWALQIFVSSSNEHRIRSWLGSEAASNAVLTKLSDFGLDDMSNYGNRIQSALSAHKALYESIKSEHILWFQLDVIMRLPPRSSLLEYAYVGAEWKNCEYPTCSPASCKAICGGGNSGLSLRRRSMMLKVATVGHLPDDIWGKALPGLTYAQERAVKFTDQHAYFRSDAEHDNSRAKWYEDDIQLSYKLEKLDLLPHGDVHSQFSVAEAIPSVGFCQANPSGMHKPWMAPLMDPEVIIHLLSCPFEHVRRGKARCNVF